MHFAQVNRNANKPESYGVQNTAFVDLGIDLFHAVTQYGLNQRFLSFTRFTQWYFGNHSMYLMYVDESGDPGLNNSPTRYFVLSGLVMHELRWRDFLDQMLVFRRRMKATYSLGVRDEIHAAEFVRSSGAVDLPRNIRFLILRHFAEELSRLNWLSVTNVVVDKQGKPQGYDVFESAWKALFQRFENTLANRNFPGPQNPDDNGIVICDDTNGGKLTKLMRKMGTYNPIPNQSGLGYRNLPIKKVIEDPNLRESWNSHPIQAADLCAFLIYQYLAPNSFLKKKGGQGLFKKLDPILNKRASAKNPYGIVML